MLDLAMPGETTLIERVAELDALERAVAGLAGAAAVAS
jgi:hypothetical protein